MQQTLFYTEIFQTEMNFSLSMREIESGSNHVIAYLKQF